MKRYLFQLVWLLGLALLGSILSGFAIGTRVISHPYWNNDGRDCRVDVCEVVSAGWPYGYIWATTWISPTNSASWMGVLLDMDYLAIGVFVQNTLFWLMPAALTLLLRACAKRFTKSAGL